MNNRMVFEVSFRKARDSRGYDLMGMLQDWKLKNPEGTRDEFLDWATMQAFEMYDESVDYADLDLEIKEVEVLRGFDISHTEWDLLRQVEGQMMLNGT